MAATTHAVKSLEDLRNVLKHEPKVKVAGRISLSCVVCPPEHTAYPNLISISHAGVDGESV